MQATTSKDTFKIKCLVSIEIYARAEHIWELLTDTYKFKQWNSTVTSLDGVISLGSTIKLKSTLNNKRTFKLKVSSLQPYTMIWEDGRAPFLKGIRTYSLEQQPNGITLFKMSEVFQGIMLPLIAKSMPDFRPSFNQIAADLKKAAEEN